MLKQIFKAIQSTKGGKPNGYLVLVNENYGCYTDLEGVFRRSVDNIQKELDWVNEKWESKEQIDFPFAENLLKELQYVNEYKTSMALAD